MNSSLAKIVYGLLAIVNQDFDELNSEFLKIFGIDPSLLPIIINILNDIQLAVKAP